jgi:hypothetical protein
LGLKGLVVVVVVVVVVVIVVIHRCHRIEVGCMGHTFAMSISKGWMHLLIS